MVSHAKVQFHASEHAGQYSAVGILHCYLHAKRAAVGVNCRGHHCYYTLEKFVAISVELNFCRHPFLDMRKFAFRHVYDDFYWLYLSHCKDGECAGHVARVVVACSDNPVDRRNEQRVFFDVAECALC